jgi:hypothetical protein
MSTDRAQSETGDADGDGDGHNSNPPAAAARSRKVHVASADEGEKKGNLGRAHSGRRDRDKEEPFENMRHLARLVMRGFYSDEDYAIVDMLMRQENAGKGLYEPRISTLCYISAMHHHHGWTWAEGADLRYMVQSVCAMGRATTGRTFRKPNSLTARTTTLCLKSHHAPLRSFRFRSDDGFKITTTTGG